VLLLFDPRHDVWSAHFRTVGPLIEGITDVGRTTVSVLGMNDPRRIEVREFPAD
jgi:hypothetical protein